MAAARLGMRTHVFEPAPDAPAAQVANAVTRAAYDDAAALARLRRRRGRRDLRVRERRARRGGRCSRRWCRSAPDGGRSRWRRTGWPRRSSCAASASPPRRSAPSTGRRRWRRRWRALGAPAILKTRRFGYDGKGQVRLDAGASAGEAWVAVGGAPSVLEGFVAFEREISVIAARGLAGEVAAFDPGENVHRDGILAPHHRPGAGAAGGGRGRGADRRAHPQRARLRGRDRGGDVRDRARASW